MIKIDCRQPLPDYDDLGVEDSQKFGKLVHDLRKQGKSLEEAQSIAYQRVTCDSVPFELD
jgi:hypothetical protein